ncbi:hypothetical protein AWC38_SpisGene17389 [Stylophora pistillata]|uniref:Uncharacterized protein n=1 Tax=Stylophora pistillata TaxID=50429 RepID=A0A2B4RN64_STYPI|nr:hypothetical protein AWC38_SpisGene17389 [Stylophora pistillata]
MKSKVQVKVNFHRGQALPLPSFYACLQSSAPVVLLANMAEWRQFENKQRQKRAAKGKRTAPESVVAKDEIIVQRMSSQVTGKQQKYTRTGPREFVPFEFDEITFDNKVEACQKHFAPQIDKDMVCNILTDGEVSNDQGEEEHRQQTHKTKKTRCDDNPRKKAVSETSPKKVCSRKFYPKSLFIQDMLKLGKVISKKSSTVIRIFKFDFQHMQWSNVPVETPFASGGFRRAFKATTITEGLKEVIGVIKKYFESVSEIMKAIQETEESHTKKSVQMQYLAHNFASQLKEQIEKEHPIEFGPTFEYKKGAGYTLYDPEIASLDLLTDDGTQYNLLEVKHVEK